ncbi:hypothetical protein K435DRAFT_822265 [Dendrothele bispora CBS 962.96]|uniref:Transposase domain-containing protein n=1 Tax=Dendrothele bispora (strain CBS 962.96) TaxID=1314807 RepID=A0A4S8LBG0_DENBC|nr:hypothetical protein K435DRAFT_822265 [Dendrothele bispora CBS 962.96]
MCQILVIWLILCVGVSRSTANLVLQALQLILLTVTELLAITIKIFGQELDIPPLEICSDIHTIYRAVEVEPEIIRTVCCPKCFTLYSLDNVPEFCTWRQTKRARKCGEQLMTARKTQNGEKLLVPVRLYSTQSFESWLQFFLARPRIEDIIDQSYTHIPPNNGMMYGIWDSPAWTKGPLGDFTKKQGNLTFSLYIDWFNPLTNKIAGKVISCGAILLCCMNLPPDIRYLPENTFFVGVTPGPSAPDFVTISHIMQPVVDVMGKIIPTHRHPEGRHIRTGLLPLIGDLQAIWKISGFLGHTQALEWKNATTKAKKKQLATQNGVRWTALYDLPYWDPVAQIVLGFMHNSLEGILQQHLRQLWSIGKEVNIIEEDTISIDSELENVSISSQHDTENTPTQTLRDSMSRSQSHLSDYVSADEDIDEDMEDDEDISYPKHFSFSSDELELIQKCIRNVNLPTYVQRPPGNLGEKAHGKLKADNYFTLFAVIFPLIIPTFWHLTGDDYKRSLLENFYHLVASTNIISSFSTSPHEADQYMVHYTAYRRGIHELFPTYQDKPNHHYAMHNGEILKYWGPVAALSEFAGERMNGVMQNINTNRHIYDVDFTMLRQMCRRGRFEAQVHDYQKDDSLTSHMNSLLLPNPNYGTNATSVQPLTPYETGILIHNGKRMSGVDYEMLLAHLKSIGEQWRKVDEFPHPENAYVLQPIAVQPTEFTFEGRTYSQNKSHKGNSAIQFYSHSKEETHIGYIESIWSMPLHQISRTFLLVCLYKDLPVEENMRSPYAGRSGFNAQLVYAEPVFPAYMIIEPQQIISHLATYRLPYGTYSINRDVLAVCWSLNRGRK